MSFQNGEIWIDIGGSTIGITWLGLAILASLAAALVGGLVAIVVWLMKSNRRD